MSQDTARKLERYGYYDKTGDERDSSTHIEWDERAGCWVWVFTGKE